MTGSPERWWPAALLAASLSSPASAQAPPGPDVLTEFAAGSWGSWAEFSTASVHNDTARRVAGGSSLRFETGGGFDTMLWSPVARNAGWNLLAAGGPRFWIYADNPNTGFQGPSPWIRLHTTPTDYVQFQTTTDLCNRARGQWVEAAIPLNGSADWTRTVVGSPDLSNVNDVEIHADTWEAGFTLWIDGLAFDVPMAAPGGLRAVPGNGRVDLAWSPYDDTGGAFADYAVYRSTSPFEAVTGLTPIHVQAGLSNTAFVDTTAQNGVGYYYAVTARFTGGGETTAVSPVGPRTPRDETDLQVISISRTPRFPRYAPEYTYREITEPSGFGPYAFTAATGLGLGQTGQTPRWPLIGDPVVHTATVRNRGTNPVGPFSGVWLVDGVQAGSGMWPSVTPPGGIATFQLARVWDGQDHTIEFASTLADARAGNNALATTSLSVPFLSFVDSTYYENFRAETPGYPGAFSDDFFDWLNYHMARFNELFALSGTAKRVHFDVLELIEDAAPDPAIDTIPFAVFPFRYRAGEGSLRGSGYYHPDDDVDYGLLHEMGHQLGLVDLYRLDLPADRNLATGQGYTAFPCLMHGVSHFLSESSSRAMTRWLNTAHGYYGQYLYALPAEIRLRVLGFDGAPLAGATVTIYQRVELPGVGEVVSAQPKAVGTTDGAGVFVLPNVPVDPSLVPPTFAGDALGPNPFGYVAVVGTNGLLHFKVEHNGGVDYDWLEITEANVAFEQGQTESWTFDRRLSLGGPVQLEPPPDLAELNAASWAAWAEAGAASAADDPAFAVSGAASVRFQTDGGFDNSFKYPADRVARWDLSGAQTLRCFALASNPNIGFQGGSPWVRLGGPAGYFEYRPSSDLLNSAVGQWREFVVPLAGDAVWARTAVGAPDLSSVSWFDLHADTWGAGFTLWLDGVRFDPPPCYADCDDSTGAGVLDFFDFVCFQDRFAAGDPYGCDCDQSTGPASCDFFDFICYQDYFAAGCG